MASAAAREQAAASGLKGRELSKHLRKLLVAVGKHRARQCVSVLSGIFIYLHVYMFIFIIIYKHIFIYIYFNCENALSAVLAYSAPNETS